MTSESINASIIRELNEIIRPKFGRMNEIERICVVTDDNGNVSYHISVYDEQRTNLETLKKVGKIVLDFFKIENGEVVSFGTKLT